MVLAREAGFSLRLIRPPSVDPPTEPPGLGRLLVVLSGRARVRELLDPGSKVLETRRPERSEELRAGQLFAVANDARWSLSGDSHCRVLTVGTTVARAASRVVDLVDRSQLRSSRLVFANEALRVESLVRRSPLSRRRRVRTTEFVLTLRGTFAAEVDRERCDLPVGWLLLVPAGASLRLAPRGLSTGVALVLSAALDLRRVERLDREAARGFTPFER